MTVNFSCPAVHFWAALSKAEASHRITERQMTKITLPSPYSQRHRGRNKQLFQITFLPNDQHRSTSEQSRTKSSTRSTSPLLSL